MSRPTRRLAIAGALLAGLAVPVSAAAQTAGYAGGVTGDANSKLTFKVIERNGKARVDLPKVKNLDATCDSGVHEIDAGFGSRNDARVNGKGEFSFDNSGSGFVAVFEGKLRGKNASGTLHFSGPTKFDAGTPDEHTEQCDSGEVAWTAKQK